MRRTMWNIDLIGRVLFERRVRMGEQGSSNGSSDVMFDFRPNDCKQDVKKPTSPHPPHGFKKNGYKKNGTKQLRLRIMGCFCFG